MVPVQINYITKPRAFEEYRGVKKKNIWYRGKKLSHILYRRYMDLSDI